MRPQAPVRPGQDFMSHYVPTLAAHSSKLLAHPSRDDGCCCRCWWVIVMDCVPSKLCSDWPCAAQNSAGQWTELFLHAAELPSMKCLTVVDLGHICLLLGVKAQVFGCTSYPNTNQVQKHQPKIPAYNTNQVRVYC